MSRGRIEKALSGFYYVRTPEGLLQCRARGKFRREGISPLVGDWVQVRDLGGDEGFVEAIEPRQALAITPTRDDLVAVFRHVKAHAQQGRLVCPPRTLYRRIRYEAMKGMNLGKLLICLDIFQEFDIFACRPWDGSRCSSARAKRISTVPAF